MDQQPDERTLREGWDSWKRSAAAFVSAASSLASVRLEMARREAREWSRAFLLRAGMVAAALFLLLFALALLAAGLVAVFAAWTGSLIGGIFIVFGIFVVAAGILLFAASRSRAGRPVLEATMREIRQDLEDFAGGPS